MADEKGSVQTWGDMFQQVATSGGAQFIFPSRAERTPVRLVAPKYPFNPTDVVRVVKSEYQGNVRDKFLVLAYQSPQQSGDEEMKIKAIILPKTAWENILGMLTEGHELFDLDEGHGVTLIRNKGQRTTYTAVPSPKPVVVPEEVRALITDGIDIDAYVKDYNEMQQRRQSNSNQNPAAQAAPPTEQAPSAVQSATPDW